MISTPCPGSIHNTMCKSHIQNSYDCLSVTDKGVENLSCLFTFPYFYDRSINNGSGKWHNKLPAKLVGKGEFIEVLNFFFNEDITRRTRCTDRERYRNFFLYSAFYWLSFGLYRSILLIWISKRAE
jgi:hypothetical protein